MGFRIDYRGAIHHVYVRGNNRQAIFRDDDDRRFFLGCLKKIRMETSTNLFAAGLMTNHFHLLPETGLAPLKTVMARLQTSYAMRFNAKYGTVGHVFQGRYQSKLCITDEYFMRLVRYIHRNPVKAGMVSFPSEWPWSGQHDLLAGTNGIVDSEFPLSLFGSSLPEARQAYSQFSGDAIDDNWEPAFDDEETLQAPPDIRSLLELIAIEHRIGVLELSAGKRGAVFTAAKREFVQRSTALGISQAEIARTLNCSEAAIAYLRKT
jgi:putative transposase